MFNFLRIVLLIIGCPFVVFLSGPLYCLPSFDSRHLFTSFASSNFSYQHQITQNAMFSFIILTCIFHRKGTTNWSVTIIYRTSQSSARIQYTAFKHPTTASTRIYTATWISTRAYTTGWISTTGYTTRWISARVWLWLPTHKWHGIYVLL